MFSYLIRSFLTPNNIKSLIGKGIFAAGMAMGFGTELNANPSTVAQLAGAVFMSASILWSWYRAHKSDNAGAIAAIAKLSAPVAVANATKLVVEHGSTQALRLTGTERDQTKELNLSQLPTRSN